MVSVVCYFAERSDNGKLLREDKDCETYGKNTMEKYHGDQYLIYKYECTVCTVHFLNLT